MKTTENKTQILQYKPKGTCCGLVQIELLENKIQNIEFYGGCDGNLQGISNLVKGMKVEDVIERLKGIDCGGKGTSCPDQLSKALQAATFPATHAPMVTVEREWTFAMQ